MTTTGTRGWLTAAALTAAMLTVGAAPATAGERSTTEKERKPAAAREAEPEKTAAVERTNPPRKPTSKPVTLYGNPWYRGVEAGVAAATAKKQPILLVRMLGELDEKT